MPEYQDMDDNWSKVRHHSLSKYEPLPPIGSRPTTSNGRSYSGRDIDVDNLAERLGTVSVLKNDQLLNRADEYSDDMDDDRPSSAKRHRPLYRKGDILKNKNDHDTSDNHKRTDDLTSSKEKTGKQKWFTTINSNRKDNTEEFSDRLKADEPHKNIQGSLSLQNYKPPVEPPDSAVDRLKLAIKLPDGSRFERYFRPSDRVGDVFLFLLQYLHLSDKFTDYVLCTNEVPRKELLDLPKSLADAEIVDRTVLLLHER